MKLLLDLNKDKHLFGDLGVAGLLLLVAGLNVHECVYNFL